MAGQITHILVGEAALLRASPSIGESVLRTQGPLFRLGSQGPDIFYHNQRTKPSGLHYGALAHRREYGRIVEGALASLPRGELAPQSPAGAYLLGLATHAAVDRRTHPFIVYYSGWADPAKPGSERYRSCHPFFERILDSALLFQARGIEPRSFDMEALMAPSTAVEPETAETAEGQDSELVALWAAGLRAAFPRSAGGDFLLERRVANALFDARHFIRITNPARTAMSPDRALWFAYLDDRAGPRSVALVYPDSLPPELHLDTLGSEGWEHPCGDGRKSTERYYDLFEAAVADSAQVLERLLPLLSGQGEASGLAALVGNGGLSVNDSEGRPVAPRISRPLALPELMRAEFEKRLEWARRNAPRH